MAQKPKVLIGFAILSLISLTFIGFSLRNLPEKETTAELSLEENSFKINFNIQPGDQDSFEKSLEKLEIPKSIKNGIIFELDSTSSAKLAVISPIVTKINLSENKVELEGTLKRPYTTSHLSPQQIKLPRSTNVAIASSALSQLAMSKLNFTQNLKDWIDANKQGNQYIVNLASGDNIFVFQSQAQVEELKTRESEKLKIKEETADDLKIIYLTHQDSQAQDQTISVAKLEDMVFIAKSPEAVKDLINFQKSPHDEIEFPKSKEKSSYVIYAKNNDDQFTNILRDLVLSGQPQNLTFTKNIDSFYIALSNQSFSGLIHIK